MKNSTADSLAASLPNLVHLSRVTNRRRQNNRPTDPTDLGFELAMDHIPDDFLLSDIVVDDARHLVFFYATTKKYPPAFKDLVLRYHLQSSEVSLHPTFLNTCFCQGKRRGSYQTSSTCIGADEPKEET